jgi:hypothetical protein
MCTIDVKKVMKDKLGAKLFTYILLSLMDEFMNIIMIIITWRYSPS